MPTLPTDQYRKAKSPIVIPDRVAERAATKYEENADRCWISTYSTGSHGYGQVGWTNEGKTQMVVTHRAAWVYHNGQQIPEGKTIDHVCKERRCVNPDHLRLLDNFENARRTSGRDWPEGTCINGHPNYLLRQEPNGRWRCPPCSALYRQRYKERHPDRLRETNRKYKEKIRNRIHNQ